MDALYAEMTKFHFTRIEAEIYVNLLQYPELNGSQLAKIVNLPRSTVYNSLGNLERRGAVILIPGNISVYQAEEPQALFARLTDDLRRSAATISDELSKLSVKKTSQGFVNIEGYTNVLVKTKEFLTSARAEIYMHTNIELSVFERELNELADRGVRVIVFSFCRVNERALPVEFYYSDKFDASRRPYSKMMMVVDNGKALIVRGHGEDDFRGVYSDDVILIDLVSEHFHHDIYLHRLEKKHGVKNIVEDDILLHSLQESSSIDSIV